MSDCVNKLMSGTIFDAALSGLLQSFYHQFERNMKNFDQGFQNRNYKIQELDNFFYNIFISVPNYLPSYSSFLKTIISIALPNKTASLVVMLTKFNDRLNSYDNNTQQFSNYPGISMKTTANQNNFLNFLAVFVISDIIREYSVELINRQLFPKDLIPKLINSIFILSRLKTQFTMTEYELFRKWSIILSRVSQIDMSEIIKYFPQFIDEHNLGPLITVCQHIHGNEQFVEVIFNYIQFYKRKKILTNPILTCFANIISLSTCGLECLNKIFDFSWNLRSSEQNKSGAIDVITSLFPLIPDKAPRVQQFYKSRVYKHTLLLKNWKDLQLLF